jgi:hypothetical protein
MSRYLIVTALSFAALNATALLSADAAEATPDSSFQVAQAPPTPAPEGQAAEDDKEVKKEGKKEGKDGTPAGAAPARPATQRKPAPPPPAPPP